MTRHARIVKGRLPGRLTKGELEVVRDVLFEKATSLDEMDCDDVPSGYELSDMRETATMLRGIAFKALDLTSDRDEMGRHLGRNR